jgi:hypothetical protein
MLSPYFFRKIPGQGFYLLCFSSKHIAPDDS